MVIRELKPSQRVEGRWLAVLEDGSILRLGEGEVVDFALYAGRELTDREAQEILDCARRSGLKERALSLLTRKPQSRRELERKLREWEASDREAEDICDRLEELGYLNDQAYAHTVAEHYAAKGCGPSRIREEFYRRGVPREYWDEALERLDAPDEAIDAFLQKKLRGADLTDPKSYKRAADALARRGFRWEDIKDGLRRYGGAMEEDY